MAESVFGTTFDQATSVIITQTATITSQAAEIAALKAAPAVSAIVGDDADAFTRLQVAVSTASTPVASV